MTFPNQISVRSEQTTGEIGQGFAGMAAFDSPGDVFEWFMDAHGDYISKQIKICLMNDGRYDHLEIIY